MVSSWFLVIGAVLITMAFASRWVARMPLSSSVFYLAAGFALGPVGSALFAPDLKAHAGVVTLLAEVAVLISLFAVGLRLRLPLTWTAWRTPVKLASVTMLVTIAGIAVVAHFLLSLPWPVALLLGAILAPTDPVLASEVQVQHPNDRDALRVALTAEGGLNDGAAFPVRAVGAGDAGRDARLRALVDDRRRVGGGRRHRARCALRHAARARRRSAAPLGHVARVRGVSRVRAHRHHLRHRARQSAPTASSRCSSPASRLRAAKAALAAAPREAVPGAAETTSRLLAFTTQCERLLEVALVLLIGAALASIDWDLRLLAFAVAVIVSCGRCDLADGARQGALAASPPAARLVRHPRHRFAVLPRLCAQAPRRRSPRGSTR